MGEPDEITSKATDLTCEVVSAGAALQPNAMNAHTNPTAESRLFFTCRWVMQMLRPEAFVTGRRPGERLQRSRVGESSSVITDFGQ